MLHVKRRQINIAVCVASLVASSCDSCVSVESERDCPDVIKDGILKPSCASQIKGSFGEEGDHDQEQFATGAVTSVWGRDYMLSTHDARENWISHGDEAVFDGFISTWGNHKTYDYDLIVTKNYQEKIEFKFKEVKNDQDWYKKGDDLDKILSQEVNLKEHKYFNFSIVVQSEDISSDSGFYDLRIEFVHKLKNEEGNYDPSVLRSGSTHRVYLEASRSEEEVPLAALDNLEVFNEPQDVDFWSLRKNSPYLYPCSSFLFDKLLSIDDEVCFSHYVFGSKNRNRIYNYTILEGINVIGGFRGRSRHYHNDKASLYFSLLDIDFKKGESYRIITSPLFSEPDSGGLSSNVIRFKSD